MANEIQGEVKLYTIFETELSINEFLTKFHKENIIDGKLQVILSDGSVHTFPMLEFLEGIIKSIKVDGEEIDIKEVVTKSNRPVTEIAI